MERKTFKADVTDAEFNAFCNSNIIYKMHFLENGDTYVFFKPFTLVGLTPVETIEVLDNVIKQAQKDISASSLDTADRETKLADLRSKAAQYAPKQQEAIDIAAQIRQEERAILMAKDTIADRTRQVIGFKDKIQELANSIPATK